MLETNIRQIAIQAIAARASGSPVEAAGQILAGIAALDSPGKPFVVWPTNLPLAEQIKALESELERIRHITQSMADYWATRDLHPQADSGADLERKPETELKIEIAKKSDSEELDGLLATLKKISSSSLEAFLETKHLLFSSGDLLSPGLVEFRSVTTSGASEMSVLFHVTDRFRVLVAALSAAHLK